MIDEKKLIADIEAYAKDKAAEGYWYDRLWGLRMAIEIINEQPKVGEWIPCSERLPNKARAVEVTTYNGNRAIGRFYSRPETWFDPINDRAIDVIAWKEPSEPWEGEDKGNK